ncbi:hypothetical protein CR513_48165, partial [Mucuna pruriens]
LRPPHPLYWAILCIFPSPDHLPWHSEHVLDRVRLGLNNPNLVKVRSNLGKLHAYDLEIDRTFHRLLRSPKSSEVVNSSSYKSIAFRSNSVVLKFDNVDFDFDPTNSDSDLGVCISKFSLDNMADNNKTLKELTTLDIMCQSWYIRYPKLEQAQSYELKTRLIHLLSKFHGLAGENPHNHLKEFHGTRNLISNMAGST